MQVLLDGFELLGWVWGGVATTSPPAGRGAAAATAAAGRHSGGGAGVAAGGGFEGALARNSSLWYERGRARCENWQYQPVLAARKIRPLERQRGATECRLAGACAAARCGHWSPGERCRGGIETAW